MEKSTEKLTPIMLLVKQVTSQQQIRSDLSTKLNGVLGEESMLDREIRSSNESDRKKRSEIIVATSENEKLATEIVVLRALIAEEISSSSSLLLTSQTMDDAAAGIISNIDQMNSSFEAQIQAAKENLGTSILLLKESGIVRKCIVSIVFLIMIQISSKI